MAVEEYICPQITHRVSRRPTDAHRRLQSHSTGGSQYSNVFRPGVSVPGTNKGAWQVTTSTRHSSANGADRFGMTQQLLTRALMSAHTLQGIV